MPQVVRYDLIVTAFGAEHKAQLVLSFSLPPAGSFVGSIISEEFGIGSCVGNQSGFGPITGTLLLDAHNAVFNGTVVKDNIKGTISSGWFLTATFTGNKIA